MSPNTSRNAAFALYTDGKTFTNREVNTCASIIKISYLYALAIAKIGSISPSANDDGCPAGFPPLASCFTCSFTRVSMIPAMLFVHSLMAVASPILTRFSASSEGSPFSARSDETAADNSRRAKSCSRFSNSACLASNSACAFSAAVI
ncbi:hypothetical protein BI065_gp02 [Weissella phage WCP30]|uniref:hypothetical protein n=1 Tax=Weissella phage WCP30 TaxID=1837862 RepID=UPI000810F877|nr:hypothetical protein BI065_gp02 [Weissella phage WCP30]ANU78882.1 hypothetical protein [Weissella phage WCP30]